MLGMYSSETFCGIYGRQAKMQSVYNLAIVSLKYVFMGYDDVSFVAAYNQVNSK